MILQRIKIILKIKMKTKTAANGDLSKLLIMNQLLMAKVSKGGQGKNTTDNVLR